VGCSIGLATVILDSDGIGCTTMESPPAGSF
jgi:hypothetical protein